KVAPALRLVGEPAAHVVGNDDAEIAAKARDHLAPVKRPRRVAVQQQQRRCPARALVHVVEGMAVHPQEMGFEGVERAPARCDVSCVGVRRWGARNHQVTLIIVTFRPEPMPINATWSPLRIWPASSASASVNGTAAGPTLP